MDKKYIQEVIDFTQAEIDERNAAFAKVKEGPEKEVLRALHEVANAQSQEAIERMQEWIKEL